jgi:ribosome maturation factor RimP
VPVNVKVGSARFFYCLLPGTACINKGALKRIYPAISTATDRIALDDASDRLLTAIQGFADPLVTDMGMELVEVQYRREGHGWVLRFFIDKEGGITIDDCAAVSRQISAYLEVEDLVSHAYHLEVSSPGLERPLKKRTDFTRYVDRLVRIKLRDPLGEQRVLIGTLLGLEGDAVLLATEGETIRVEMENIAKARLTL